MLRDGIVAKVPTEMPVRRFRDVADGGFGAMDATKQAALANANDCLSLGQNMGSQHKGNQYYTVFWGSKGSMGRPEPDTGVDSVL